VHVIFPGKVLVSIVPGDNPGDIVNGRGLMEEELTRRGIQVLVNSYRGLSNGFADQQFEDLAQVKSCIYTCIHVVCTLDMVYPVVICIQSSLGGGVNLITLGLPVDTSIAIQPLVGQFYTEHLNNTVFTDNSTSLGRASGETGSKIHNHTHEHTYTCIHVRVYT